MPDRTLSIPFGRTLDIDGGTFTSSTPMVTSASVGTAGDGVAAVEYGDGRVHSTSLALALTLPAIAGGEKRITVASHETGARYALSKTACRATRSGDGFAISGEKTQVLDANEADAIVVVARTSGDEADDGGLTLLLVTPDSRGVKII